MYAIIRSGGKQYKVKKGDKLRVDTLRVDVDSSVDFPEVLALHDGDDVQLGKPLLESAKVTAKVLTHGRAPKIIVFTKKRRGGHHRKKGHRQNFTEVLIEDISAGE